MKIRLLVSSLSLLGLLACGGTSSSRGAASPTAAPVPEAAPAKAALSKPIVPADVAAATGNAQPETTPDGVVRVAFPRKDVEVVVDGSPMAPFMGLTSWAAFSPGRAGVADAMVMGDLVLFEDEVNQVMSVLLDAGVSVTALHNHFFFDDPKVFFLHIGGEGTVAELGKGVRAAMAKVSEIRAKTPKPARTSGAKALSAKSAIDGAKLEAVLGSKGQAKDGMFKATIGRPAKASCGCDVGKTMGVNTWAAFAGTDEDAVVDGDFAVTEDELQPVLKALRSGRIDIVAIHHHMTGETPRILFLHYWGRGKAVDLATTVRKALDQTKAERST
jgi:hypothetical protein